MLMLSVRSIYIGYWSVEYDSKHILNYKYKEYSVYFSSIEENGKIQYEYIN